MSHLFGKKYKLTGKKLIEDLYTRGTPKKDYPFVVKILEVNSTESPLQFAIAVSKRNHKKAVSRNVIKRRIREAIRLNKEELETLLIKEHKQLAIFVIYTAKEIHDYAFIERKFKRIFKQIISSTNE